jgi:hypothetical protein
MFMLTTVYMGALLRSLGLFQQLNSGLHPGFNTSRFLYAFGVDWLKASGGQLLVYYLCDYTQFENFVPTTIMGVLIWISDILVVSALCSSSKIRCSFVDVMAVDIPLSHNLADERVDHPPP